MNPSVLEAHTLVSFHLVALSFGQHRVINSGCHPYQCTLKGETVSTADK